MKTKRIFIIIMLIIILISPNVFADDDKEDEIIDNEILTVSSNTTEEPDIFSRHVICIERTTNLVLYEKNAYEKTAMASTTKIMTAIIALETHDLNESVLISDKAATTGGSTLGIFKDTQMTLESLLYGLLLRSGNDCAVAIAEYIGGDLEGFATLMNNKAKELGLKNTNFVTPHGLDSDEHYTTAYDLAILTNYALNNEIFKKIVGTKQISIMIENYERTLNNTNELLGNVNGIYGVKTGFTGNAGRCLVTACKREDLDVIVVVLGSDTKKIRGLDSIKIIEYVFNNYKMIDTREMLERAFNEFYTDNKIKLYKSDDKIKLKHSENYTYMYPINKNRISNLKTSIYCISVIKAPANFNSKIGVIRLEYENEILYSVDILIDANISRRNWKNYFGLLITNFKKYYNF